MVVQVDLGLRRDEDFEFRGFRDVQSHPVVEGVDAFDDDRLVLADFQDPAGNALAAYKVEAGELDFFAVDEVDHVLVE